MRQLRIPMCFPIRATNNGLEIWQKVNKYLGGRYVDQEDESQSSLRRNLNSERKTERKTAENFVRKANSPVNSPMSITKLFEIPSKHCDIRCKIYIKQCSCRYNTS